MNTTRKTRWQHWALPLLLGLAACTTAMPPAQNSQTKASGSLNTSVQDEILYFVMIDRFANGDPSNDRAGGTGEKMKDVARHGFHPKDKGFYLGGDLKGITAKLDYLKELGITGIWISPVMKNKAVQGSSAGYHGYWIVDFLNVDPHLGTNQDMKDLVAQAHQRGMKIYLDIITNHTADVIGYQEGFDYRSKTEYPYTKLNTDKSPINQGFQEGVLTPENFAKLTNPAWAYTPTIRDSEKTLKNPPWLNDPIYYHNRGNFTDMDKESAELGDFFGLDDLFTENPKVLEGMIEIYKHWIREFRVDGFRIDTVKHVNIEFWQKFSPEILAYAKEQGIPHFFMFGEVYDSSPAFLSTYTTKAKLPSVLDFGFQRTAKFILGESKSTRELRDFYESDDYYTDSDSDAGQLVTFLGNHDMGRVGMFLSQGNPQADDAELVARMKLAHALMYFGRGVPTIYYGDEQGFTGQGGDKDARQTMFPSQVKSYLKDKLIGTKKTHAEDNFDPTHPIYQGLKAYAQVRGAHKALRQGVSLQRQHSDDAGFYAFSRVLPEERLDYLVVFNTSKKSQSGEINAGIAKAQYTQIYPAGGTTVMSNEKKQVSLTLPALEVAIYRSEVPIPVAPEAPTVQILFPKKTSVLSGMAAIRAKVSGDELLEMKLEAKRGEAYELIGVDRSAPYKIYFNAESVEGKEVTLRLTVTDAQGRNSSDEVTYQVSKTPQ